MSPQILFACCLKRVSVLPNGYVLQYHLRLTHDVDIVIGVGSIVSPIFAKLSSSCLIRWYIVPQRSMDVGSKVRVVRSTAET